MVSGLFRQEALEAQKRPWIGSVRIISPISHAVWTLSVTLVLVTILAWLYLGHYTRRERVTGLLVPKEGLADLATRFTGTVTKVYVTEGMSVKAGDIVVVVSGEHRSETHGDTEFVVSKQLQLQALRLHDDIAGAGQLESKQEDGLRKERAMLGAQLLELKQQLSIESKQVSSNNNMLAKMQALASRGYASGIQVQQQESQALDAQAQVKTLQRQYFDTQRQVDDIDSQLSQLPLATQAKVNDLQRQIAQNQQALVQNEAYRASVIQAPIDGTVSAVLVRPGENVTVGQSLVAIVPTHATLLAQIMVPSTAVAFVHEGMDVVLHYQAFPYQKFGVQRGTVLEVSRSALTPGEGMSLLGQPLQMDGMYRVLVSLKSQSMLAYGKREPLKPGMALDADLLLERRRLIEWFFEPLYGMRKQTEAIGE